MAKGQTLGAIATFNRRSGGGSCLLDRPPAKYCSDPKKISTVDADRTARTGEVFTGAEIPAAPNRFEKQTTEEVNVWELWFLLHEKEREEFGAVFSKMVMRFFYVLTKVEDS